MIEPRSRDCPPSIGSANRSSRRLKLYFHEAISVMAERDYKLDAARSHACFAVFTQALTPLQVKGLELSES